MSAALFGYAMGMFLAAGGAGYILILSLKAIGVHKRWPRATYVIGCLFVLLVGLVTAGNAIDPMETVVATIATLGAVAFIALYRSPFAKKPA